MNPYLTPKSIDEASPSVPRFRLIASMLGLFVGYMVIAELVPQLINATRLGRLQNPIGLILGATISALVTYAAYVEWCGKVACLRNATPVCVVLVPITVLVTARFVLHFAPLLSVDTLGTYYGAILGQVFCAGVWLYSANVLSRHRVIRQYIEGNQAMDAEPRSQVF
ncbi:hypothetical protein LOC71_08250 [Rhodopirellula sp. JC740]|uniref:Integral membrane protein n=1 Tax=Rhodopirellula halodulae TaxID=2894198 RepID=A0ABS8NFF9_9BACT|nr:hypothetical protein [Rhodopirellula sp. JC740]MCC9642263.1 hypothetical protein [Rhodopirellula sp. JC740]